MYVRNLDILLTIGFMIQFSFSSDPLRAFQSMCAHKKKKRDVFLQLGSDKPAIHNEGTTLH